MKKLLKYLAVVGFVLALSSTQVLALTLTGISGGDVVQAEFQNWDSSVLYMPGSAPQLSGLYDSFALLNVTGINDVTSGKNVWSQNTSPDFKFLTGTLSSATDTSVSITHLIGTRYLEEITSNGGIINLYAKSTGLVDLGAVDTYDGTPLHPVHTFSADLAPSVPYTVVPTGNWGAVGTGSELWLSMQFVPGTFSTSYIFDTSTGAVMSGSSGGYLNVLGGSAQSLFDTNTLLNGADMYFYDGYTNQEPQLAASVLAKGWTVASTGDAAGRVPEPASLLLLGLGLFGLGIARRFKKN